MSQRLIARNPDLKQLQDDGYDIRTHGANVIIRDVPYLNSAGQVKRGTLVSVLDLDNDTTTQPTSHEAFFAGEQPHEAVGKPLRYVINNNLQQNRGGVDVSYHLSAKPKPLDRYRDYHHKMTAYIRLISHPARKVDPNASARTNPVIVEDEEETVFNYVDSASSRAGLEPLTNKLKVGSVAIVGLGGTGAYILDLLAKTPVGHVHLFDGDTFHQHNAFRAPGAPTNAELADPVKKVHRFGQIYSAMRREIVEHDYYIDDATVGELQDMDSVFIAIDNGAARKLIVEHLEQFGVTFIDVGMGVKEKNTQLSGMVRTTTSTPERRSEGRLSFGGGEDEDDYARNIQIADLNMLNAVLAVIRWKKLVGFYTDVQDEHQSLYTLVDNYLINTDPP